MKTYRERAYIALVQKMEYMAKLPLKNGAPLLEHIFEMLDMSPLEFVEYAYDDANETATITVPTRALADLVQALGEVMAVLDYNARDEDEDSEECEE